MKLRVALYCLLGGLPLTVAALGVGHFIWWWLSGILFASAFVPVALFGPRRISGQFGVIVPVFLIVTVVCTLSEAVIFAPSIRQHERDFAGGSVIYVILAAVLAVLASLLKLSHPSDANIPRHPPSVAALMVLLCGLSYVVYYYIFGAITYQFFTKAYYPEAIHQAERLGPWFWVIQFARGALMTLAVVPIIRTLRMKRWHAALAVGSIIWIAGGAAPLLVPTVPMGTTLRLIHTLEIFTQNSPLGLTAVMLLRPKSAPHAANSPVVSVAPV